VISKVKRPYEFLVRWGDNGEIAGAHVQFIEQVIEDGQVIASKIGDALPVSLAGEHGFPLAELLDQKHIIALETIEGLRASHAAQFAELESARNDVQQLTGQIASLSAKLNQVSKANAEPPGE
jgi:hypothetical protein